MQGGGKEKEETRGDSSGYVPGKNEIIAIIQCTRRTHVQQDGLGEKTTYNKSRETLLEAREALSPSGKKRNAAGPTLANTLLVEKDHSKSVLPVFGAGSGLRKKLTMSTVTTI